jgi:hypothetical protein
MAINSTKHFTIPLHQHKPRGVDTISLLLILLSLVAFLYTAVLQSKTVLAISFGVLVLLILRMLFMPVAKRTFTYNNVLLLMAAAYWFFLGGVGIFAGILLALAAVLETRLKVKPELHISTGGVAIKDAFNRQYNWADLANVIIKDGLITIDCKNNKLIQKEPEADITADYEREINDFCNAQLKAGVHSS